VNVEEESEGNKKEGKKGRAWKGRALEAKGKKRKMSFGGVIVRSEGNVFRSQKQGSTEKKKGRNYICSLPDGLARGLQTP